MIFCVKLDWATESSPSPKDVGNKSRRELGFGRGVVHSMIIKFYFIFFSFLSLDKTQLSTQLSVKLLISERSLSLYAKWK